MKKISVIIPCYNAEKYMHLCMESLEKQSIGMDSLELIFINNASTDRTLEMLKKFRDRYPFSVKIIDNKKNQYQGGARNLGLASAEAEFVAFMDDDDKIESTMLEKLYRKANEYECDMAVCFAKRQLSEEVVSDDMGRTGHEDAYYEIKNKEDRVRFLEIDLNRAVWNKLYRKSVITGNHIMFPEHMIYDDIYFSELIKHYVKKIYVLQEYLYHHIVYPEAASINAENWQLKLGYFDACVLLIRALRERQLFDEYAGKYEDWFFIEYISVLYNFLLRYKKISFKELKRIVRTVVQLFPDYARNKIIKAYLSQPDSIKRSVCSVLFLDLDKLHPADGDAIGEIMFGIPNEKQSFKTAVSDLICILEKMVKYLLENEMSEYNDSIRDLSKLLSETIPVIISSYSRPELKEVASDAVYWSNQLAKIVEVMESKDRFKILDVLYYETRNNLISYKEMIQDLEIDV